MVRQQNYYKWIAYLPEPIKVYWNQNGDKMGGLKYYERTKLLIELIEKKKTGTPVDLARKLQVHERTVYRIIDELRLTVSFEIIYCKDSVSYIFFKNN